MEIHNQLFLPKDLKAGERRPAIVFVHGGPVRQMMPAYHYMQFYHWAYGINQWLASQGYVVLSINYRGGVGYGRSFRAAPQHRRGRQQRVSGRAGGRQVPADARRCGSRTASASGACRMAALLTSQALARNSDIFKAGVDLAGVHLCGSSLDPGVGVLPVVDDRRDRRLEIAGAAHSGR